MTRSVNWRQPIALGEVELLTERTNGEVQRQGFGVTAKVCRDFSLAVAPGINTDSDTRGPVVVQGVIRDSTMELLLLPAQAGVDGEVLAHAPRILCEERVVARPSCKVQVPKLSTSLEQNGGDAAVRTTTVEARDRHLRYAAQAKPRIGT